jgi:hypothetical protein
MQARKERAMFEGEFDEGIDFLFERKIDADADRFVSVATR